MVYQGNRSTVSMLEDGIATMHFNAEGESVNKFDMETNKQLGEAVSALEQADDVKGLIVTSGKGVFIAGADITEFVASFQKPEDEIKDWGVKVNGTFNRFEDLPFPKVAAINGAALGGGCEMTLVCEYRVMSEKASIGLPETQLGIFPGFGGTVRSTRVIGIDNALELIATGKPKKPLEALKLGLVDATVAADDLPDAAVDLVKKCISGELD